MDDLVVILLTLLVAAFGIISQSKKRKAAMQQPNSGKAPQNFWDLIESQIAPEPEISEPVTEFEEENEIIDVIPIKKTYDFDAINEGKSSVKENAVTKISKDEIGKSKKKKFPLKKAVIYSEILKQKYI